MSTYKTTKEYFDLSVDELMDRVPYGNSFETKEENLLRNEGIEVVYFDDEKEVKSEEHEFNQYIKGHCYKVKAIVLTINERIAYVLEMERFL